MFEFINCVQAESVLFTPERLSFIQREDELKARGSEREGE